jgi:hypothetical protein
MERILLAAGVPQATVALIPAIIDTCRECRAWQSPGHDPTPSVEIAVKQNDQCECDILFYKQYLIFHVLDRADRWHAAGEIPDKLGPTL